MLSMQGISCWSDQRCMKRQWQLELSVVITWPSHVSYTAFRDFNERKEPVVNSSSVEDPGNYDIDP